MARRSSFLLLLALFVGFSSGAEGNSVIKRLWFNHPWYFNTVINPATNYCYAYYLDTANSAEKYYFGEINDSDGSILRIIKPVPLMTTTNYLEYYNYPAVINNGNSILSIDDDCQLGLKNLETGDRTIFLSEECIIPPICHNADSNYVVAIADFQGDFGSYLVKYSFDSMKVVDRFLNGAYWGDMYSIGRFNKVKISPKGNYIGIIANCILSDENHIEFATKASCQIVNANSLKVVKTLEDINLPLVVYLDDYLFKGIAFDDEETKIAVVDNDYNLNIYSLPDFNLLSTFKIEMGNFLYFEGLMFDSTGTMLIFDIGQDPWLNMVYNIETNSIEKP